MNLINVGKLMEWPIQKIQGEREKKNMEVNIVQVFIKYG